jgi:hypothetical protein
MNLITYAYVWEALHAAQRRRRIFYGVLAVACTVSLIVIAFKL